jgi:hypothetical protein
MTIAKAVIPPNRIPTMRADRPPTTLAIIPKKRDKITIRVIKFHFE